MGFDWIVENNNLGQADELSANLGGYVQFSYMFDDESEEDFLVYTHKKSRYIQLAIIRVRPPSGACFPDVLHQSIRGLECTLAGATSIAVVDEFLIREFFEESHIEMVDDPVAKF